MNVPAAQYRDHYSGPDQLVVDEGAFFRLLHNLVGNAKSPGCRQGGDHCMAGRAAGDY